MIRSSIYMYKRIVFCVLMISIYVWKPEALFSVELSGSHGEFIAGVVEEARNRQGDAKKNSDIAAEQLEKLKILSEFNKNLEASKDKNASYYKLDQSLADNIEKQLAEYREISASHEQMGREADPREIGNFKGALESKLPEQLKPLLKSLASSFEGPLQATSQKDVVSEMNSALKEAETYVNNLVQRQDVTSKGIFLEIQANLNVMVKSTDNRIKLEAQGLLKNIADKKLIAPRKAYEAYRYTRNATENFGVNILDVLDWQRLGNDKKNEYIRYEATWLRDKLVGDRAIEIQEQPNVTIYRDARKVRFVQELINVTYPKEQVETPLVKQLGKFDLNETIKKYITYYEKFEKENPSVKQEVDAELRSSAKSLLAMVRSIKSNADMQKIEKQLFEPFVGPLKSQGSRGSGFVEPAKVSEVIKKPIEFRVTTVPSKSQEPIPGSFESSVAEPKYALINKFRDEILRAKDLLKALPETIKNLSEEASQKIFGALQRISDNFDSIAIEWSIFVTEPRFLVEKLSQVNENIQEAISKGFEPISVIVISRYYDVLMAIEQIKLVEKSKQAMQEVKDKWVANLKEVLKSLSEYVNESEEDLTRIARKFLNIPEEANIPEKTDLPE